MNSLAVDDSRHESDPQWLEAMMDATKLEALTEAVVKALREKMEAGDRWRHANEKMNSLEDAPPEDELNKLVEDGLRNYDRTPSHKIRDDIKGWASRRGFHLKAKAEYEEAEKNLKACAEKAHAVLEALVSFFREQ